MADDQFDIRNPRTGDPRTGIRITTPIASLVAADTVVTVHDTNAAEDRKHYVRKVIIENRTGGTRRVLIGDGTPHASFTARLALNGVPNGVTIIYTEDEIPNWE